MNMVRILDKRAAVSSLRGTRHVMNSVDSAKHEPPYGAVGARVIAQTLCRTR